MPEMNILVVLSKQKILQLPGFTLLRGEWGLEMACFLLSHVLVPDKAFTMHIQESISVFQHLAHFERSHGWKSALTGPRYAVCSSNFFTFLLDWFPLSLLYWCVLHMAIIESPQSQQSWPLSWVRKTLEGRAWQQAAWSPAGLALWRASDVAPHSSCHHLVWVHTHAERVSCAQMSEKWLNCTSSRNLALLANAYWDTWSH